MSDRNLVDEWKSFSASGVKTKPSEAENKLIHAGANRVVLPTHIGAEKIAEMILFPETADFVRRTDGIRDLKRGMGEFGLEIEIVKVVKDGALTDMSVIDAERSGGGAIFVVHNFAGRGNLIREFFFLAGPFLTEGFGIGFVGDVALENIHTFTGISDAAHIHRQRETVK